jgi:MoaA/NifB/PqqE/SkfB family radical SAM enzyme
MFKFKDLKEVHLEITNNCQASCPMCARNRNGGLENPLIKLTDWTLDEYKIVMHEQLLKQLTGFFFCGNFGDPILNKDLLEMCRYSTQINPNLNIRIHTNGSAKSVGWWKELAAALPKTHTVVFALDGLDDTHNLYRIGTSFDNIIKNAKAFINSGGIAEWCFIKFKHNEHQVNKAGIMAKELGFNKFVIKESSRFLLEPKVDVLDKNGTITHIIEPATETPLKFLDKKAIDSYKQIVAESTIDCQAFNQKEIYIDAFRNVFPCCWLASLPYTYIDDNAAFGVRKEMLDQYYDLVKALGGIDRLNAVTHTIEDIIDSIQYQTVWKTYWGEKKLITCARMCGRAEINDYAKSRDQQQDVMQYV